MQTFKQFISEENREAYLQRLVTTLKIKKIGEGLFAHVFQHPQYSNVVVKIFTSEDKNYAKYLKFVLANQESPYVPKLIGQPIRHKATAANDSAIKTHGRYAMGPEANLDYQIVFMEKYESFDQKKMKDWIDTKRKYFSEDEQEYIDDIRGEADALDTFDWTTLAKQKKEPNLAKLAKFFVSNEDNLDFHSGNIMFKGATPIFTDPVA